MKKSVFLLILLIIFISCSSTDDSIMQPQNNEEEMMEEEVEATILSGTFIDAAHPTSGMAMVNEDGTELMLTNFKSDDGPNLELYIATDVNATNYITLGSLKGLEGDFIYDLPENIDFVDYNYVMVWCVPFSVNFGHAILE